MPGKKTTQRTAALSRFIAERLEALGLSASAAGRAAGLERTAVRDIYRGSVPGTQKLIALARALGTPAEDLLRLIDAPTISPAESRHPPRNLLLDANDSRAFDARSSDLPLLRQEVDSVHEMVADKIVAHIARPTALSNRPKAYAVYVPDDLNAPLLMQGHIAYIDPSRPVQIGNPVRAFLVHGAPFLGILRRQDAEAVELQVLAEPQPRRFNPSEIDHLERVIGFNLLDE